MRQPIHDVKHAISIKANISINTLSGENLINDIDESKFMDAIEFLKTAYDISEYVINESKTLSDLANNIVKL